MPIQQAHAESVFDSFVSIIECSIGHYTDTNYEFDPKNFDQELECLNGFFSSMPQLYSSIIHDNAVLGSYITNYDSDQITTLLKKPVDGAEEIDWENYRSEMAPKIEHFVTHKLITDGSNQEEIDRLNRNQSLEDESLIFAFQSIPTIDPDTKKVVTMETFSKKQVDKIPALQKSDIGKNPSRAMMLMMLDREYILYVQIIPTPNNELISIEEASMISHRDEFEQAKTIAKFANLISHGKDPTLYEKNAWVFIHLVRTINNDESLDKNLSYYEYLLSLSPNDLQNIEIQTSSGEIITISKLSSIKCNDTEINVLDTALKAYSVSYQKHNKTQLDNDFRKIVNVLSSSEAGIACEPIK